MIGWIVKNIGAGEPAIAIGDAEGNIAAWREAGFHRFQEWSGFSLMFKDFEKCDEGELGRWALGGELGDRKGKDIWDVQLSLDEAYGGRIKLYSCDLEPGGT